MPSTGTPVLQRLLTRAVALTFALATLVAACGADGGTSPATQVCADNTASVSAQVSGGATPQFDWAPRCPMALVLVEDVATGHDAWFVSTLDADSGNFSPAMNRLAAPVRYGVRPAEATHWTDATPLTAGTSYRLVLWRVLPAGSTATCIERSSTLCLVAVKSFTP